MRLPCCSQATRGRKGPSDRIINLRRCQAVGSIVAANQESEAAKANSKDGKYLYFEDILEPKEPVYRMRTGDARPERWTDFDSVLQSGVARCQFTGLAPDGSVLAIAWRGSPEIYSLDLDLP